MKCQLITYNRSNSQYYTLPVFKTRRILKCDTKSGVLIESALLAMATAAFAKASNGVVKIIKLKKISDNSDIILMPTCSYAYSIEEAKEKYKSIYDNSKNVNIFKEHAQLYQDALNDEKMQSDTDILNKIIFSDYTVKSLDILGKRTLETLFDSGIEEFDEFCRGLYTLSCIARNCDLELLKLKINPENTNKYRKLQNDILKDKRKINRLLESSARIKRENLEQEINTLKSDKSNSKRIKELKSQIQNLYKESKNSNEIRVLMDSINEKQIQLKDIKKQKVDLSSREIIKKLSIISVLINTIYLHMISMYQGNFDKNLQEKYYINDVDSLYNLALGRLDFPDDEIASKFTDDENLDLIASIKRCFNIYSQKDIREMFDLIKSKSPENNEAWNSYISHELQELFYVNYDKRLSKVLNLAECDYLEDLVLSVGDTYFYDRFEYMLGILSNMYSKKCSNVQEYMDILNVETKNIFQGIDVDYNKWAHYDKNSYIEQNITISAEAAKQKTVKNLCDELTSTTNFSNIPQQEIKSLFKRLSEIGVQVDREQKTVKINGRDIIFKDLNLIINTIFEEFVKNPFWSKDQEDEIINNAADLLINHFNQRDNEIINVARLKEHEKVNIKVRKADMNDIKYALCLGNYSHCCAALGAQINEWTAPMYVLTKCIGAIEVIANDKPVGNTMIYIAKVNGETALVLDDIEMQIKFQNNDKIRDMIIEYAKKLCEEIGKPNIPIYANGNAIHKVDMSPYRLIPAEISILGKTLRVNHEPMAVYLDYDNGTHEIGYGEIIKSNMYKLV